MFNELYELKQDILMLERLRDGLEFAEEQFEYYLAHNQVPTTLEELVEQIKDFHKNWICNCIPDDVHSMWLCKDYTAYTSEFHYRKMWNEIANDKITQYYLDLAFKMISVSTKVTEKTRYSLRIYDFNDFDIYFNTEQGAENFVNTYDVDAVTLFKRNAEDAFVEVRAM